MTEAPALPEREVARHARLLSRLRVGQKALLSSAVLIVPTLLLLYYFTRTVDSTIAFAERERCGVAYSQQLRKLIENAQAPEAPGAAAAIDAGLSALDHLQERPCLDSTFGQVLQTDAYVAALREKWLTSSASPGESREFLPTLYALFAHAGDTSNLILDPDLDTYYVMDFMQLRLPEAMQMLARFGSEGDGRAQLERELLEQHILNVGRNLGVAVTSNHYYPGSRDTLRPTIAQPRDRYLAAMRALLVTISAGAPDHAGLQSQVAAARTALLQLYDVAAGWEDGGLRARIEDQRNRKRSTILIVGAVMSLALMIAFLAARDTVSRLHQLALYSRRMAAGSLDSGVQIHGSDEVAQLAGDFSRMSADLKRIYSQIEQQVQDRTEEARVAREAADAANRAKSDFLANVSHEIRTPMNAVIGMAQLALRTEQDPKQRTYLKKIEGSAQALMRLINDILDVSKIEAGRLEIEHIAFSLDEVTDNLADLMAVRAQGKDLELVLDVPLEVPRHLEGDPLRLGQILINLAANAIKFTPAGEVRVRVRSQPLDDGRVELCFEVADTGIGMTAEQQSRLFQPFSQADSTTTRKYGGTGLGLAISRHLVQLMGGSIGVDSEPGRGSRFWCRIPFATAPAPASACGGAELSGLRCLIVDDVATAREIESAIARDLGMRVTAVDSGEAAIEAVRQHQFDIVLMDYRMPGRDGVDSALAIKRDARLARPPVVVMVTAHGREDVRDRADAASIDGFLLKPVSASSLRSAILAVVGRHDSPLAALPARVEPPAALRGASVLLAEDNEINCEIAVEMLREGGVAVEIARNGREAVEMAARHRYDAILMDLQMPEMDGLDATRVIRRSHAASTLPIIAMTANVMASDRERCLEAGMNDHLGKPIDVAALWASLLRWIGERSRVPAAGQTLASDDLPPLPGVDLSAGLQATGGKPAFYRKLLLSFRDSHGGDPGRIGQALEAGDCVTARRLAHTLKSVAGSLGAAEVQAGAAAVEAACADNRREQAQAALGRLASALSPLLDALRSMAVEGSGAAPVVGEALPLSASIDALRTYLRSSDTRSGEALAVLVERAGPTATAELSRRVSAYDFNGALLELERMETELGRRG